MKYIKIEQPISLVDPSSGDEVSGVPALSAEEFVNRYPLNDKRFGHESGFQALSSGIRIQAAYSEGGPVVALEESDWETLKETIVTPNLAAGAPMSPEMARQYIPHMASILNASAKDPSGSESN